MLKQGLYQRNENSRLGLLSHALVAFLLLAMKIIFSRLPRRRL